MSENNGKKDRERSFDSEELSGILETVGQKVPQLIRDIMGSLYSRESGINMGQAIGAYYKELLEAGNVNWQKWRWEFNPPQLARFVCWEKKSPLSLLRNVSRMDSSTSLRTGWQMGSLTK